MFTSSSKIFLQEQYLNNKIDLNTLYYSLNIMSEENECDIISFLKLNPFKKFSEFKILQEISYKCSGKCPYCMNKGLDYSEPELPVEEYIKFYKKVIDNEGKIDYVLTGGEPFEPCNFERTKIILNFIKNHEESFPRVRINTNGYWKIPVQYISKNMIIQFSLDGDSDYIEKITGLENLYNKIINNFDLCILNNIEFQIRSVIDENNENLISFLRSIAKKYNKNIIFNWVVPVGGAKDNSEKDKTLIAIKKTLEYNKLFQKEQDNLSFFRGIIGRCHKVLNPETFKIMITPSGKIGLCPFLGNYRINNLNIYNFDFLKLNKYKIQIKNDIQDRTCCFPNGFLNFWKQLSQNEKLLLSEYINLLMDCENGVPNIKNYYQLKEDN